MVSKLMSLIIALNISSVLAHDNFNQISANAGTSALYSSHLKLNHQSYFYIPNGDAIILDLSHSLHSKHFQNDIGLAYRTFLHSIGIGANFYYQHSNRPKTFLHQFSPGLELLYKNLQVSYNLYIPFSVKMDLKRGAIYHSKVSEIGVKWYPRKDFNIGLLPFYDHTNNKWGISSKICYILKETFEFGIAPYFTPQGKGVLFSFGVNFGPARGMKPIHRSNEFNYFVKHFKPKKAKIFVDLANEPVGMPIIPPFTPTPVNPPNGSLPTQDDVIFPFPGIFDNDEKEQPSKVSNWWEKIPFIDYKGTDVAKKKEEEKKNPAAPDGNISALSNGDDFFFIPPWEEILSPFLCGPGYAGSYV